MHVRLRLDLARKHRASTDRASKSQAHKDLVRKGLVRKALLRQNLPRTNLLRNHHREEGRRCRRSSACPWRRASPSLHCWLCCYRMAKGRR